MNLKRTRIGKIYLPKSHLPRFSVFFLFFYFFFRVCVFAVLATRVPF